MLNQILYTACVTPFEQNTGNIDFSSLEQLLKMQEKAGNGVIILGSTGESLSINDSEKRRIVDFVCGLKLRTEVIVGVPSHNLSLALDWLEFCNPYSITGYLIPTPIYTKPGISGQTLWFSELLNKSAHAVMLYNIPGRSGVTLYPEVAKNLICFENLLAIKDSSGRIELAVDYAIAVPGLSIYCGDDYMMPAMALEGAVGLVSVVSNVWPNSTRRYVESALIGRKLNDHTVWWSGCKSFGVVSNPIPIKALLRDLSFISSDFVRIPLSMDDLKQEHRDTLLYYDSILRNWGN